MSLVVAFFALAWWPLQQLTSKASSAPAVEKEAVAESSGQFTVSVVSSHPLKAFAIEYLGQPLLEIDKPGLEIEQALGTLEIPDEGIEFWVKAVLAAPAGEDQRPVIRVELIAEDPEIAPMVVNVWGQTGEPGIEDAAFFKAP